MEDVKCRKCGKIRSVHSKRMENGHWGVYSYYYMAHSVSSDGLTEKESEKREFCRVCGQEIKYEKDRNHFEAWCVG